MRALLVASAALLFITSTAAAPPTRGLVVPGKRLGGLSLGATPAQVRSAWGSRFGVCRDCRQQTWYFNYRPLEPPLGSVTSPLGIDLAASSPPVRLLYDVAGGVLSVAFPPVIVAATGSLVLRFWRARRVERQQLRWVALAAALVPVAVVVAIAASAIGGPAADTVSPLPSARSAALAS